MSHIPPPPARNSLETFAAVAVVLAALLACKGGSRSSPSDSAGSDDARPGEKPIAVTAAELYAAYHANEVAADEKYKGKLLGVVGLVISIDKDAFDNMIVRLDTKVPFQEVHATMKDSEKSKVAQLSKGQVGSFICRGGGMIVGSPVVDDCTVFQSASVPAASKK